MTAATQSFQDRVGSVFGAVDSLAAEQPDQRPWHLQQSLVSRFAWPLVCTPRGEHSIVEPCGTGQSLHCPHGAHRPDRPAHALQVFREGADAGSSDEEEDRVATDRQQALTESELLDMGNGNADLLAASEAFCTALDREAEFDEADALAVQSTGTGAKHTLPRMMEVGSPCAAVYQCASDAVPPPGTRYVVRSAAAHSQRAHSSRLLQQVMDGSVYESRAAQQVPGRNDEQVQPSTASATVNAGLIMSATSRPLHTLA